ncbi:phosphopentomutase [Pseudomaricurvus alkylphenolicus]|uniref:phosphopentomutase n=1 Tax=Pseudomaricurvus alkylphenolicus TaxID=1306991 RepID=UPI00141F8125|nr:phosphopentomutase [Pseudomaricurvus alkylphenolicus]NIB44151.1 phosphopentomutase [Pseudomaricurvus alkylphenolicus]
MKRALILVLDSFGIGSTEDAERFGDAGSNTLGHIAQRCAQGQAEEGRTGPLRLPNLTRLGLMHAAKESSGRFPEGCDTSADVMGAYAHAKELSSGKDTSSGHWEMTGVPVKFDWGYFTDKQDSFPEALLDQFVERAKLPGVLGNCHASGTEIIARLGEEHCRTGKPIVYTSADSVFQIACHEEAFGLERLLEICQIAFDLLEDYNICRVIARPFVGANASQFKRTGNRRDFSVKPPQPTLLDSLIEHDRQVLAVGKIYDIFAGQGVSEKIKASGLEGLFDATLETLSRAPDQSLVFTNFVDFDSEYGHRRDVNGYARALEYFDQRLPELFNAMGEEDLVVFTADHGCDPTWKGSDHTREHVPILVYSHQLEKLGLTPGSQGRRETFADIGQTLANYFNLPALGYGISFTEERAGS